MLSMFGKSKKSVSTPAANPHQPSPPRLDRLPPTTHGHPDGGALSRVVMVCKTEQSTVTSTGGAEETVTRVTVSTFRGNNRAERRVTTTEKSTPGTPRTPKTPAIVAPAPQVTATEQKDKLKNAPKDTDFAMECLNAHNEYRALHKVPPLILNRKLCRYAEEWAKHLAERNAMEHRNDIDLGENIFSCWVGRPNRGPIATQIPISGREPVESWYKEASEHPYGQEPINLRSGHFSQVVWRDSRELGVGVARSKQGHVFVVANYSPPGNFIRNFAENVPPPGGFPNRMAEATPQSSESSGNDHDELNAAGLRVHNEYRRKHGSPNMVTDKKVAAYAKEWATHLARENKFMHRPDGEYGENIYTAWSSGGPPMTAAAAAEAACKSWYAEEKYHKYGKEPKDLKAGHFTQMVWSNSTKLGMGIGRGDKNRVVVVANYNPRGNIIGQFGTQVPKKKK